MRLLTTLFTPRRVLLVGASQRAGTLGRLLAENLEAFPGEVICKGSGDVLGKDCHDVDLAVVATPGPVVAAIVDQLAHKAKVIVVLSAGFAETGAVGRDLQAKVVAAAHPARVVGPNCFGVQDCNARLNASIAAGLPLAGGGIALVSQAGTYAMSARAYSHDDRVRFGKVIALGNASDVSATELMGELRSDPASTTLCFALESLPDARRFIEQVRLTTPRKPVVVYKAGHTDAGARSAASHTGAVAAPSLILRDALAQAGAVQVSSGEELFDAAQVFDMQPPLAGPRIGVLSNSGGAAVEMVDALADQGLTVPVLSDLLRGRIGALIPGFASARNPVDITPVWSRYSQLYPEIAEILSESGELDAVVVLLTHRAAADEDTIRAIASRCGVSRRPTATVPIYVCTVAGRAVRATLQPLQDEGIPCLDGPARTARAVGHVYRYTQARRRGVTPLPPIPDLSHRPFNKRTELAQLLTRFGIPLVPSRLCRSLDAVERTDVKFPAVIKIADAEHRTERDGVRLNLMSRPQLMAAAADLITRAAGGGLLVQPQLAGVEMIVGAVRDSSLGPVVMVGLGGIWVEILNDIAFALVPIRHDEAVALISGLEGYPILSGARGTPPVSLDRVAHVVVQVGQLVAEHPEITTLTLNPVLVTGTDAVAVDWKSTSP